MSIKESINQLATIIDIMNRMMHDEELIENLKVHGVYSREPDYLGLDYEIWDIWATTNNLKEKLEKIKD